MIENIGPSLLWHFIVVVFASFDPLPTVFAGAALQASKQDSPSQEEVMQSCAAAQAQQKISKPFLIVPLHQCGCKRYRKRLENVLQTETNKTAARFLA